MLTQLTNSFLPWCKNLAILHKCHHIWSSDCVFFPSWFFRSFSVPFCRNFERILETVWCERWSLEHISLFRMSDDQREITFSLLETGVMLLAIAVNSQYSNMKNRLLRQQIEIWIATCLEQTANQNTDIAWQYCKVARKRTTGFTVKV